MNTQALISELIELTLQAKKELQELKQLDSETLNFRPAEKKWSVLEVIEHLTYYGDFYIPEFTKRIKKSKYRTPAENLKPGMLGAYFVKSIQPVEGFKPMQTLGKFNPINSEIPKSILETFETQLDGFLKVLEASKAVDLNKTKASVSIAPWMKLKLCDLLRVVIYHNQRHFIQIDRVLEAHKLQSKQPA